MKLFAGAGLFNSVVMLLLVQGCSTTASTTAPHPVIEKSSPAPVAVDRPIPVEPLHEPHKVPPVAPQPAAVLALLDHAEQQANEGDLESSSASLERAIRINPGSAVLWYHLATVRLAQDQAQQAEQLAVKSNSLAPGNAIQQQRNWALIAKARHQRGDPKGANHAEQRARELERQ